MRTKKFIQSIPTPPRSLVYAIWIYIASLGLTHPTLAQDLNPAPHCAPNTGNAICNCSDLLEIPPFGVVKDYVLKNLTQNKDEAESKLKSLEELGKSFEAKFAEIKSDQRESTPEKPKNPDKKLSQLGELKNKFEAQCNEIIKVVDYGLTAQKKAQDDLKDHLNQATQQARAFALQKGKDVRANCPHQNTRDCQTELAPSLTGDTKNDSTLYKLSGSLEKKALSDKEPSAYSKIQDKDGRQYFLEKLSKRFEERAWLLLLGAKFVCQIKPQFTICESVKTWPPEAQKGYIEGYVMDLDRLSRSPLPLAQACSGPYLPDYLPRAIKLDSNVFESDCIKNKAFHQKLAELLLEFVSDIKQDKWVRPSEAFAGISQAKECVLLETTLKSETQMIKDEIKKTGVKAGELRPCQLGPGQYAQQSACLVESMVLRTQYDLAFKVLDCQYRHFLEDYHESIR